MKPSLFIASSVEGLDIAYAIQKNLKYDAEVTIWSQGIFNPSNYSLEDLENILESIDFSIFVFSADDESIIREERLKITRDNVLFEMGLFMGKLGRKRVFSLKPNNTSLHIPSDLIGMNILTYENDRQDKNLEAGTGVACNDIRNRIRSYGAIERNQDPLTKSYQEEIIQDNESKKNLEDKFYELYSKNEFKKCIEVLENIINGEKDPDKVVKLKSARANLFFKINPEEGEKEFNNLFAIVNGENKLKLAEYKANVYYSEEYYDRCINFIDKFEEKSAELSLWKVKCMAKIRKNDEYIEYLQQEIVNYNSIILKLQYFDIMNENIEKYTIEERLRYINSLYIENQNEEQIIHKYAYFAHYTLENYQLALYLWSKLCDKFPKNADYLTHLGNVYCRLNLSNSAIEVYEKANELVKERAGWILSNIGNLYNNRGLHFVGRKYLRKALEINTNDDYVLNRLADTVQAEKNERESKQKYLKSAYDVLYAEYKYC